MTDIHQTLGRLANIVVAGHIMKSVEELVSADSEASARDRLAEYLDYDIIPIRSGGKIRAFLERGQSRQKVIQIQYVIGGGTPILDVVDSLSDQQFVFVVGRGEVVGFVHFSDLNDPVVKLPFFVLLEGVERRLGDAIEGLVTKQVLSDLIRDKPRLEDIYRDMDKLQASRADRDWVTLMSFSEILHAAVHFGKVPLHTQQIEVLSGIRNRVCHPATGQLVGAHPDVRRLKQVRDMCIRILEDGAV